MKQNQSIIISLIGSLVCAIALIHINQLGFALSIFILDLIYIFAVLNIRKRNKRKVQFPNLLKAGANDSKLSKILVATSFVAPILLIFKKNYNPVETAPSIYINSGGSAFVLGIIVIAIVSFIIRIGARHK